MEHIATAAFVPTSANCSINGSTTVTADLRKLNNVTVSNDGSGLTGSLADTNANDVTPVSNTVLRRSERVAIRKQADPARGGQAGEVAKNKKRKHDEGVVRDGNGGGAMGDAAESAEKKNAEENTITGPATNKGAKRARRAPYKEATTITDGGEGSGTGTNVVAPVKTQTRRKRKKACAGSKAKGTKTAALVTKETTEATSNVAETNRESQIVGAPRDADRDGRDSDCTVEDLKNTDYWYSQSHEPLHVDPSASAAPYARVSHRPIAYSTDTARFHQPKAFPPDDIRSTLAHEDHIERVAIELLLLRHRCMARVPR